MAGPSCCCQPVAGAVAVVGVRWLVGCTTDAVEPAGSTGGGGAAAVTVFAGKGGSFAAVGRVAERASNVGRAGSEGLAREAPAVESASASTLAAALARSAARRRYASDARKVSTTPGHNAGSVVRRSSINCCWACGSMAPMAASSARTSPNALGSAGEAAGVVATCPVGSPASFAVAGTVPPGAFVAARSPDWGADEGCVWGHCWADFDAGPCEAFDAAGGWLAAESNACSALLAGRSNAAQPPAAQAADTNTAMVRNGGFMSEK